MLFFGPILHKIFKVDHVKDLGDFERPPALIICVNCGAGNDLGTLLEESNLPKTTKIMVSSKTRTIIILLEEGNLPKTTKIMVSSK
jgi:hypothetical protein